MYARSNVLDVQGMLVQKLSLRVSLFVYSTRTRAK